MKNSEAVHELVLSSTGHFRYTFANPVTSVKDRETFVIKCYQNVPSVAAFDYKWTQRAFRTRWSDPVARAKSRPYFNQTTGRTYRRKWSSCVATFKISQQTSSSLGTSSTLATWFVPAWRPVLNAWRSAFCSYQVCSSLDCFSPRQEKLKEDLD